MDIKIRDINFNTRDFGNISLKKASKLINFAQDAIKILNTAQVYNDKEMELAELSEYYRLMQKKDELLKEMKVTEPKPENTMLNDAKGNPLFEGDICKSPSNMEFIIIKYHTSSGNSGWEARPHVDGKPLFVGISMDEFWIERELVKIWSSYGKENL